MKIKNFIKILKNNICIDKMKIFIILFLSLTSAIITFSFSYYMSIRKMWFDWQNKSYDFKLAYIMYDEDNNPMYNIINQLKNNKHVMDVFYYNEFMIPVKYMDVNNDYYNGNIRLLGTIPNNKKIKYGKDISKVNEIICPSNFFPDSLIKRKFDAYNIINLEDKVYQKMTFKYIENDIELNLVGIFDANSDYSDPNICYTTHDTILNLNKKFQPNVSLDGKPIYIQIDNKENLRELYSISGITKIVEMKKIRFDVGNKIFNFCAIFVIVFVIFCFFILSLFFKRKIINDYKNIGIYLITGYKIKMVKMIYLIELIVLYIPSIIFGIIISHYICSAFVKYYLFNDPQLSLLNISINYQILLMVILITFISIIIPFCYSFKVLNSLEISKVIND